MIFSSTLSHHLTQQPSSGLPVLNYKNIHYIQYIAKQDNTKLLLNIVVKQQIVESGVFHLVCRQSRSPSFITKHFRQLFLCHRVCCIVSVSSCLHSEPDDCKHKLEALIRTYASTMKMSNIQYVVMKLQNGCHLAILNNIHPKIRGSSCNSSK